MCRWSMMREAREADKRATDALIREKLGTGYVTKAPMGMRNVTPANMERLVRGQAVEEAAS